MNDVSSFDKHVIYLRKFMENVLHITSSSDELLQQRSLANQSTEVSMLRKIIYPSIYNAYCSVEARALSSPLLLLHANKMTAYTFASTHCQTARIKFRPELAR